MRARVLPLRSPCFVEALRLLGARITPPDGASSFREAQELGKAHEAALSCGIV